MAKYVVTFEQWVKGEKVAFISSHYDGFAKGKAGVLDSMLIPAFSMLIKQGVTCAVEGDIKVAMAMSILKTIAGCSQLSEIYSIDFDEDICIIGHSGSGDADISEKKPTIKIVPLFHGKTGGGYPTQFYPRLGPVTYLGITQDKDGHFKLVVAEGINEPGPIFTFGDTNMRTRFTCGAREFCNRWSETSPIHHMAAATGRHIDTILKAAKIFNVPVDIITRRVKKERNFIIGILDISIVKGYIRMCNDGWLQGWHERNGGNLTYRMKEEEVAECHPFFNAQPGELVNMGVQAENLAGEHFITTGFGKFFRNVEPTPYPQHRHRRDQR